MDKDKFIREAEIKEVSEFLKIGFSTIDHNKAESMGIALQAIAKGLKGKHRGMKLGDIPNAFLKYQELNDIDNYQKFSASFMHKVMEAYQPYREPSEDVKLLTAPKPKTIFQSEALEALKVEVEKVFNLDELPTPAKLAVIGGGLNTFAKVLLKFLNSGSDRITHSDKAEMQELLIQADKVVTKGIKKDVINKDAKGYHIDSVEVPAEEIIASHVKDSSILKKNAIFLYWYGKRRYKQGDLNRLPLDEILKFTANLVAKQYNDELNSDQIRDKIKYFEL